MLKLRNAVLTALLAFCLAMPFVSCSFNDGATGDVSNLVKEQPGNNQNGGNGGSTGGNEKPSGGDEDSGDNGNENPSGGDNGGNGHEHPSGGDSGTDEPGTDEPGTDYPGTDYPGTDEPGSGDENMYTVMYNGKVLDTISAEEFSACSSLLTKDTDYTISGNVITLTDSGFKKGMDAGFGEDGDDSGTEYPGTEYPGTEYPGTEYPGTEYPGTEYPGTDYPGTDYPGTDYPGTDYPGTDYPGTDEPDYGNETMYTVMYNGAEITAIPASELSYFETVLTAGTDYTISETVITLTESGFNKLNKLTAAGSGAGE